MTEEKRTQFSAELDNMTISDVIERMASLDEEVRSSSDIDAVNEMAEMKQMLKERKSELEALEERKASVVAIEKTPEVAKTIEERREEEKTMEERTFGVETVEYRNAYLKSLQGKELEAEERAALTKAGSVIPTETVNKVYGRLEENALIGKIEALHIPGYVSVPVASTVNDAAWVAMATAATDSADVVDSVSLGAKKLIKTIEITADVQAMSIPAFEDWLVKQLTKKMERAICAAIIGGTGTTTIPSGITKAVTAQSGITTVAVDKLAALMSKVASQYHAGAVFIMTAEMFYTKVLPLAADSNGVVINDGIKQRIFGHEVIFEASCGSDIFFGNLEGYVFNFGEGITIEADKSVAFRSGSTVYRAMALCDGAVADANAFARATIA